MFVHMFMFRWNESATDADKDEAVARIRDFAGRFAGLNWVEAGLNTSARGNGFGLGCVMLFDDQATFEAYFDHPHHRAFVAWISPMVEAVDVDFESREARSSPR